tara:strand:- start:58592 stop:59374 length:783 start_codon:yes stop_codon:yes gene_type:complete
MKKIVVTGAFGQLGLSIQDIYKDYPVWDFTFLSAKQLDITNEQTVQKVFKDGAFDYCINCAAYTNVEQAEKTPKLAFKVNAEGVRNIALSCKKHHVMLFHISTDYVFDGEKQEPYTVNDSPNPINEYGKSKLAGEKFIQEILDHYYIVRTSWLYSKIHGRNFYKTILEKAQKGEALKVTDEQIGCPTNTTTLSKFILNFINSNNKPYGIYHFTDNISMTWYEFAKEIIKENGLNKTTTIVRENNYRSFAIRPLNSVLLVN